ncbi:MAG: helix-turn-helix transcriptional regulator [Alphaproteobacteria bacterium]|nr:helix-turn-helix transcriptional regulator [Alphaproteobacteria bacterium]
MDKGASLAAETSIGLSRLTQRERECLRLVDRHMSSKEIARELGLSKHTVDWHLDKARRRLGAPDRYAAARLVSDRASPIPPSDTPPPIGSGSDTSRLGQPSPSRSHDGPDEGAPNDRVEPPSEGRDRAGHPSASGRGALSPDLADAELSARPDAALHLEPVGAPAFRPVGDQGQRGPGLRPDDRHPQAGGVQARRAGAAGNPVHRQRGDGRDLPVDEPRGFVLLPFGGEPNALTALHRLGFIAAVMIATALAFGSVLAGLKALEDLF